MKISQQTIDALRYNIYIKYISASTVKFTDEVINNIKDNCNSIPSIREYLISTGIPCELLTRRRITGLYERYISKCTSFEREHMGRKYFSDEEIQILEDCEVVISATKASVNFTSEFKSEVASQTNIKSAIDILGMYRIKNSYYRFRDMKKKSDGSNN